jgi:hypothetical protein
MITIDLTKYVDRVGARVDPGRYRLRIVFAEVDKSKAGDQMITLNLTVVGGEFDGSTVVDRLVLTSKAMFRTVNLLQALGIATPRKRLQIDPASWIDRIVEADLADGEPYRGSIKSEVQGYVKPEKVSPSAPVGDGLDQFLPDGEAGEGAADQSVEQEADQTPTDDVDLDDIKL